MTIVEISYEDASSETEADQEWVSRQVRAILAALGEDEWEVGVSFIGDESMRQLNRHWRGIDESTDILSFSNDGEDLPLLPEEGILPYLGDLAISLDALKRNAQSFNVETEEELLRLLIHGILHLLGADHATNEADEPMLVRQEALLAQLRGSEH